MTSQQPHQDPQHAERVAKIEDIRKKAPSDWVVLFNKTRIEHFRTQTGRLAPQDESEPKGDTSAEFNQGEFEYLLVGFLNSKGAQFPTLRITKFKPSPSYFTAELLLEAVSYEKAIALYGHLFKCNASNPMLLSNFDKDRAKNPMPDNYLEPTLERYRLGQQQDQQIRQANQPTAVPDQPRIYYNSYNNYMPSIPASTVFPQYYGQFQTPQNAGPYSPHVGTSIVRTPHSQQPSVQGQATQGFATYGSAPSQYVTYHPSVHPYNVYDPATSYSAPPHQAPIGSNRPTGQGQGQGQVGQAGRGQGGPPSATPGPRGRGQY